MNETNGRDELNEEGGKTHKDRTGQTAREQVGRRRENTGGVSKDERDEAEKR